MRDAQEAEIKIKALETFVNSVKQAYSAGAIDDIEFIKNLEHMVSVHIDINYKPEVS